ncbi:MAG: DNA modification system-associated small protein [Candidatus Methylumidiphilus sp.]
MAGVETLSILDEKGLLDLLRSAQNLQHDRQIERHVQDLPLWKDAEAFSVLEELCDKHKVPTDILRELVAIQRMNQHRGRARGIYDDLEEVFNRMD